MRGSPGVCALVVLLWISAAWGQDLAEPGPFAAAWQTVTVSRPGGGTFQASVFYPGEAAKENAPFAPAAAPAPGITFGHGFVQPVTRYTSTLQHLATWGFVVIASQSESGLFPSHANFAADMRHCLTWLEEQNAGAGTFSGRIAVARFGASGHSMGGGCSILAAAADARIRAVAPLAAANTSPSAITASQSLQVPVSYICGTSDTIVPTGSHSAPMYAGAPAPKLLPSIQGGWHCGFQDVTSFGCDSGPMKRAEQLAVTRRILTSFFLLYLTDEQDVWRQVWGPERDADLQVLTTADPGVVLDPAAFDLQGFGGQSGSASVQATNTAGVSRSYEVRAEIADWGVQPASGTGMLGPGAQGVVAMAVQFPHGFARQERAGLVSARSLADGGTRAWRPLTVVRICRADLDRSGSLNIADFTAMLSLFAAGSPDADIDGDGVLTISDFSTFLQAFAAGCA
jgi:predicted dienelactone hydrolase